MEDLVEFVLAKIDNNPPILRISNKEKAAKKLKFPSKVDELEKQFKAAMIWGPELLKYRINRSF